MTTQPSPEILFDAAARAYQAGDRSGAGAKGREILASYPNHGDALNLLAILAQDERRLPDAEELIRRAVAIDPRNALYLNTLGTTLLAQGRTDEAIRALTDAANAAPREAEILFNLANAQRDAGLTEAAVQSYQGVISLRAGHLGAYNNLATLLKAAGEPESAVTVLIEAIAYAPKSAELRFNLGNAMAMSGQASAAEAAYRKAIQLNPKHLQAMVNLGVALAEKGRKTEAEELFRQAIELDPTVSQAYVGLADLADDSGSDAVAYRRAVLAMRPDLPAIRSSLLMCMQYDPKPTRAEIAAEHRAYGAMFERTKPPLWKTRAVDFDPNRKLRLGVVSGDFRFHAMLFFALPVFEARDKTAWELTCYSTTAKTDVHTRSFHAAADRWRDVRPLAPDELAQLIVRDQIDVLIDLSGHAPHNRLVTFAAKPAPLQVAWGDYVDTRGLKAIDVLLGDPIHTPAAGDPHYTERVVRLPKDYICYRPPAATLPVASTPAGRNGFITFGCFSEITKIGPAAVAQWIAVLKAIPDARMLINNHLLTDTAKQGRLLSLFMDAGIGAERISFKTGGTHAEFLSQYAEVDAILDTAPYSGGLTTCEALLMGVPVLTVTGDRFCGRHATAHLTNGGYPEGVAASVPDLVTKARALAAAAESLTTLRRDLRARFLGSAVCDVAGFARAFYSALRTAWAAACVATPRSVH
ncbi:MAG: tetratricopeptide repeat protein [Alphaproteobacteria bacterium]|nr:tetratricopeptide repeat protein [Alphaproteobacteria bacterium]